MWDPGRYRQFSGERSRAFYDLIGRIGATDPRFVADIGCGPGELTMELCRRWPEADVVGVDSSPEMITAARALVANMGQDDVAPPGRESAKQSEPELAPRLRFELQDASEWEPGEPVDVIVSNALLQWIPDHEKLLARWLGFLADGGWLAFQLPGNFDQPTHLVLRELADSPRWRPLLADVALNRQAADPGDYLDLLARRGCVVDAWETTYSHVLTGEDPVLKWYMGTGLRPVINALEPDQAAEFIAQYGQRMKAVYAQEPYGTVLPFRRVFVVAHR